MRVTEIITEEQGFSFHKVLIDKGYKFLGAGIDQSAYLEPGTGQVLKIFRSGRSTGAQSKEQQMAIRWINYCKQHEDNPFLPKYSGWSEFELEGDWYLQIRMERLLNSGLRWENAVSAMADYAEEAVVDLSNSDDEFDQFISDLDDENKPAVELLISLGDDIKLLWDTLVDIIKIAERNGYGSDLHAGNIMIHADGTPVIIDPWVV